MNRAVLIARVLLGLPLVVFGLNGFFDFLPTTDQMPADAVPFLEGLEAARYFMPLMAGIQVACGAMLVTGLFVPLALTLFAPILVNIVAFHLVLDDPANGAVGYVMLVLELFLAWAYGPSFRGVLAPRARPRGSQG